MIVINPPHPKDKWIIWFEEEGKSSIKNDYNEIFYYNSKYWREGSKDWATSKRKKVLVQRAKKVWRVTPDGTIMDLNENEDYRLID